MPKLQAACTMTAQDEMVLRTAQTSEKAAQGQDAVLEFILLNHPLDCPDCDKGGECPLQDLTFRWGPGKTRMVFPKRTFDKPIPISPTITLDRERCILCYRCTRFSEGVSEDGQLVAKNRGASSLIATFEDEPYRAHFSGNVTELCPVGALLPSTYRFKARPWEIDNVPTVCGLCPVGCNTWVTVREGKAQRVLSRNHPEVDDGWLCDKGRFAFGHLRAGDRIREPLLRVRRRGFDQVTIEQALDEAERGLREAGGSVVVAFSGGESVEHATALARLVRGGPRRVRGGAHPRRPRSGARRVPGTALRDPGLGGLPRRRRRAGRRARSGRRPLAEGRAAPGRRGDPGRADRTRCTSRPGGAGAFCASPPARESRSARQAAAERRDRVVAGRTRRRPAPQPRWRRRSRARSALYVLPRTPNGRGVASAWHGAGEGAGTGPSRRGGDRRARRSRATRRLRSARRSSWRPARASS